jgi:hypothetical protein
MTGPDAPGTPDEGQAPRAEDAIHEYRAAGIRERTGRIPLWLIGVCVALFVWGAYYIVKYWTPQG